MKYRKQYMIDKKFQLKKSFSIIGSVSIIIAIVIITAGTIITLNSRKIAKNNTSIINNTKSIRNNIEIQQNNLIEYSLMPHGKDNTAVKKGPNDLITDYNRSMDMLNKSIKSNEDMLISNNDIVNVNIWLFIIIILVTVIGIAILFLQLIRETHRISGPIFVMKRYIKEILDGKSPDMRDLREKDDLKEFYVLFKQMADRLIELEKK